MTARTSKIVKSKVSLTLSDFSDDPSEITRTLAVEPTDVWRVGDLMLPGLGTLRAKVNIWQCSLRQARKNELLSAVLDRLLARFDLARLARVHAELGCYLECGFTVWMTGAQEGFSLEPEVVGRLAALGAGIDVDIYYIGGTRSRGRARRRSREVR